jgi:hypothetical protein
MMNLFRAAAMSLVVVALVVGCGKGASTRVVVGGVVAGNQFVTDSENDSTFFDSTKNCIQYVRVTSGSSTTDQIEFYAQAPNADTTCSQDGTGMLFSLPLATVTGTANTWQFYKTSTAKPFGQLVLSTPVGSNNQYSMSAMCQYGSSDVTNTQAALYKTDCTLVLSNGQFNASP